MGRRLAAGFIASAVVVGALIGVSPRVAGASQRAANPGRTVVATLADNGHSYRLRTGDVFDVQLSGPSGFIWSEPASSNDAVLQRTGGSSCATATATFTALAKGKPQVMATGSPSCSEEACPTLLIAFRVTVSVVG